jgi:hypothetical protein
MKKLRLSGAFCACMFLFGFVSAADAALIHWGAQAGTSVADCPGFCTSFNFGPTLGGENVANSGISSVSEFRGDARASASLTGGLSTPLLRAESAADPNTNGAFATAFGIQGYTYNGAGETLTLDIALDGLVTDPEMDPSDTRVYLDVVLYAPDPFGFFLDRGTLDFEVGAITLSQPDDTEASVSLQLDHLNTTNDSGQISIEVATGDEFYIWAFLRAESQSGLAATSADAFNTGSMSFVGKPDLAAASTAVVPLPAAVWLFGFGMLGLIGIARRKKTA